MTEDLPVINRFVSTGNKCDGCRWLDEVAGDQFPCSHCIENPNHVQEES